MRLRSTGVLLGLAASACATTMPTAERATAVNACYGNPERPDTACLRSLKPLPMEPSRCARYENEAAAWVDANGVGDFSSALQSFSEATTKLQEKERKLERIRGSVGLERDAASVREWHERKSKLGSANREAAGGLVFGLKKLEEIVRKADALQVQEFAEARGKSELEQIAGELESFERRRSNAQPTLREWAVAARKKLIEPNQKGVLSAACYVEFEADVAKFEKAVATSVEEGTRVADVVRKAVADTRSAVAGREFALGAFKSCSALKDVSRSCQEQGALGDKDRALCAEGCAFRFTLALDRVVAEATEKCVESHRYYGKPIKCALEGTLPQDDPRVAEGLKVCTAACSREAPRARREQLAYERGQKTPATSSQGNAGACGECKRAEFANCYVNSSMSVPFCDNISAENCASKCR